jgi:hypothetical protein
MGEMACVPVMMRIQKSLSLMCHPEPAGGAGATLCSRADLPRRRRTAKDLKLPRTWHAPRNLRSFDVLRRHLLQRDGSITNGGSGGLRMTRQASQRIHQVTISVHHWFRVTGRIQEGLHLMCHPETAGGARATLCFRADLSRRRRTAKDLKLPRTWHAPRNLRSFDVLRRHLLQRDGSIPNGGSGSLRMTRHAPRRIRVTTAVDRHWPLRVMRSTVPQ